MTHSRKQLTALMDEHGLRASRALGQNFVVDPNTVRRIARMAEVGVGDRVVEIGAGLGSLTLALAETGADVTAIELDRFVFPVLQQVVQDRGVHLVEGDALAVDWNAIVPPDSKATVVANLPYNVGTHIVVHLLEQVPRVQRIVVMLQKEVAQRLAATPGSEAFGALSVKVRYFGDARLLGTVPPTVFVPKPEVDSAIVAISRLSEPRGGERDVDRDELFRLVETAFGQRRKMLRRTLSAMLSEEDFARAGVAPTERPEQLDVDDWARLAACRR